MSTEYLFTIFGYIGSSLIAIMMYPQVYLTIKSKKTRDLSIIFLALNMTAVSFIIPYAFYFNLIPIIIANISVGLCNLVLIILWLNNYYNENKAQI